MRSSVQILRAAIVALVLGLAAAAFAEDLTYGIEVNGVLCGYADIRTREVTEAGDPYVLIEQRIFAMLSALGMAFNQDVEIVMRVDPETWQYTHLEMHIEQADVELNGSVSIEGNVARCVSLLSDDEVEVTLPEDVMLETPLYQRRLQRDFADAETMERTYEVLAVTESAVQLVTYTRVGEEALELAGETYACDVFDQLNHVTGVKARMWFERDDYLPVQVEFPNNRLVYLADPSIRKQIELVNIDEDILVETNVAIPEVQAISYMKVRAKIEPTGLRPTVDGLNVPGQKFVGTVKDNRIEGVFEIEHPRYDGAGAPAYPAQHDPRLKPYLEPDDLFDADDPVLSAHAARIAEGSADSWEAACRLSRWVADNIEYAIPGGGTPRKVYDLRAGECGGHSFLLATLCRSVGIPSRVVWGCMYSPNFGGAFGQHAWTEIHMGDAGWIPVDATAYEIDYVDSGHIRIGEYQSMSTAFNGRALEVLDYRVDRGPASEENVAGKYGDYLGEYDAPGAGAPFVVRAQDGALFVDVPNQMSLPFHDPDESGRWVCKLTPKVYCTFARDDDGEVTGMSIHEVVSLARRSDPEPGDVGDDVPEALRPYLGSYYLAAMRAQYDVIWEDGALAIHNIAEERVIRLHPTGVEGEWIDDDTETKRFSFATDHVGKVTALIADVANEFTKRAPVSIPMLEGAG